MNNNQRKELCLALMRADSEAEVVVEVAERERRNADCQVASFCQGEKSRVIGGWSGTSAAGLVAADVSRLILCRLDFTPRRRCEV